MDNTWLNQCAFYNTNITRRQPNNKGTTYLTPTFYGIPDKYHTLKLKDFFSSGVFLSHQDLNNTTKTMVQTMKYHNIKSHIKDHIGPNKKYDAIVKEKLPQKKYTHSNTLDLMMSIKKGSGMYRKTIERANPIQCIHNPHKWRKKLENQYATANQVKKSMMHLHSPYLDSSTADQLSRLKLGKTMLNNQLHAIGIIEDATCNTCTREYDQEITEDYKHALFHCAAAQKVIKDITNTFFPNINTQFSISEVLLSVTNNKHYLYKGQIGQETTSLIWDLYQSYIITCRTAQTTPISNTAITEIRSQLNRIRKTSPKSKVAIFLNSTPSLIDILLGII